MRDYDFWGNQSSGTRRSDDYYDVAEICLNGHVTNDSVKAQPGDSKKFCDQCGQPTITKCTHCQNSIRGYHHISGLVTMYDRPSYCIDCGTPYPWIKQRIDAALELADIVDEFTDEDRRILAGSLDDLVTETPKTQVSALKVKKVLSKASGHIVGAFRDIMVDVMSETVKKSLFPDK